MLTPWRVRLLGDFRVERGRQVVTRFRSKTATALFAFLCLHPGRRFSREELADKFWPDAEVEAGRASLRVALNSLKKALEPPPDAPGSVLEADRESIRLRPEAVVVDVREFEKAIKEGQTADALSFYGGDFLPGFWDEWILDEQARLQALLPAEKLPLRLPGTHPEGGVWDERERSERFEGEAGRGDIPHGNLPLTLDAFFGREKERAELVSLLGGARLVTLLGPGGVGKTRMALEVAREAANRFSGGAWFVPLAAVTERALIPDTLCTTLGVGAGSDPQEALKGALRGPTLLVLDNLEQIPQVGLDVEKLLGQIPTLFVLVTSRIRLGVPGERVLPLEPLPLPAPGAVLATLAETPAVALFCDRARQAAAEFGLTERNAGEVSALCRQLEGLPLALELAAAWAGALSVAQMRANLESRLALAARKTDREARHLSLRAAIDWSVELLTPELRRLFFALSVFRGGFPADAAGEVAAFEGIHDGLSRLRSQSLLVADLSAEPTRFTLQEAIRERAEEELTDEVRERHAAWALREGDALQLTLADEANVRAALEWFRAQGRQGDFLRLTGRFAFTWFRAGWLRAGDAALSDALALDSDALAYEDRLPVYRIRGAFRHYQQDGDGARQACEECIALAEAHGDATTAATMMMDRATTMLIARRFPEVQEALEAVLPRLKALERRADVDTCLHNIAICALERGQLELARASLTEALEISRGNDAPGTAYHVGLNLNMLARLARYEGDLERAAAIQEEAEAQLEDDGNQFYLWFVRIDQAVVRALQGRFADAFTKLESCRILQKASGSPEGWLDLADTFVIVRALAGTVAPVEAQLLGAAEALRRQRSILRYSQEEADVARAREQVRNALGENVFAAQTKKGEALSLDALIALLPETMTAA